MQRRTRNVIAIALIELFGGGEHRQQHAENGLPRLGFAFDNAAVIADDFGHQRKTQPAAGLLCRDEWIEQVRSRSSGTPGPLSLTQNSSGNDTRDFFPGTDKRTPGRNAVVS